MKEKVTIGLPIIREEPGEKRVFLPDFLRKLVEIGYKVSIERGYGNSLGLQFDDYINESPNIHSLEREDIFKQDFVLILRSPHNNEFQQLGEDTCLISMLHYPTHPIRRNLLEKMEINAISLDSVIDDFGIRLVENMRAVAWNGLETAFNEFENYIPNLIRDDGTHWQVLVIGTGMVGKQAVDAATKLGKRERNLKHMEMGGPGAIVTSVSRNFTAHKDQMIALLSKSDIVVDASQRYDPSKPIIPNTWIAYMPDHAIIVDLSVDPYSTAIDPPVVKGIEGIPQGNLDKYIFFKDDPHWDLTVPPDIPSINRRKTITCYSWPGIHPEICMRYYGQQLIPLMRALYNKGYHGLSPEGRYFERALFRARIDTFLKTSLNKHKY